jgi:hypothetical protein
MEVWAPARIWSEPLLGRLVAVFSGLVGYLAEPPSGVGFEPFGRGLDAASGLGGAEYGEWWWRGWAAPKGHSNWRKLRPSASEQRPETA